MALLLTPNSVSSMSFPYTSTSSMSFPYTTTTITPNTPGLSLTPTSATITSTSRILSPLTTYTGYTSNTPYILNTQNTPYTPMSNSIIGYAGIGTGSVNLLGVKPASFYIDIDTGMNDSLLVQKEITRYFKFKTLDKWIFTDFSSILKYLTYKDDKVYLISKLDNKNDTDISKDSNKVLSAKKEYIEENILTESKTREILIKIMNESPIKWYELTLYENLVKDVIEKYLKTKFKKMINNLDK